MNRQISYTISNNEDGLTVKQFLISKGYSHPVLVQLKKTPRSILLNDEWLYFHSRLSCGDILTINIEETESSPNIVSTYFPLDIIYEDDDIIVINKSANMPIHPSMNNYDNSLANALMYYYRNENSPFVYRCINRLDKDTSGLTVIAKNPLSAAILYREMNQRNIHRTYYALVEGNPPSHGTINEKISRMPGSTIMRCVDNINGETAVTHFKTLKSNGNISLVECRLETGRTHQIRVHMTHIGHPLLGDYLYNPTNHMLSHHALHGGILEFLHPITQEKLCFHAPFEKEFAQCLKDIEIV